MRTLAERIGIGVLCIKTFGKKRPVDYKDGQNLRLANPEKQKRFIKNLFDLK